MSSPNLAVPHVAAAQAQKEVTINQAVDLLDRAVTDVLTVDLGAGDVTLTAEQYRRHRVFRSANLTTARTLTLPAIKREVSVDNGTGTADLTVARGTGTVVIPAGAALVVYTDGSTNGLRPIGGVGGGGANELDDLNDVTITSPVNGDLLQYDGTEWENVPGTQVFNRVALPFRGALIEKTGTQSLPSSTDTAITFDGAIYDTDGFWSSGNPTRLSVPAGVSRVRLSSAWRMTGGSASIQTKMLRNGVEFVGMASSSAASGFTTGHLFASSAVVSVAAGDYFEVIAFASASRTIDSGTRTWFAIEVVETSTAADPPGDWSFRKDGTPAASEVLLRAVIARKMRFAAALAGSVGYAGTAATATTDLDVRKNGTSFGTIRFPAASSTATFIAATATVFDPGDRLEVVAPASPDATLGDIMVTLAGALVV
jgi:hypothetical protein